MVRTMLVTSAGRSQRRKRCSSGAAAASGCCDGCLPCAGANLARPTIRTTNDMPIVDPGTFRALCLTPFQINAHYPAAEPASPQTGETRQQRILEFLEENDVPVLGLREGTWLRVSAGVAVGGVT